MPMPFFIAPISRLWRAWLVLVALGRIARIHPWANAFATHGRASNFNVGASSRIIPGPKTVPSLSSLSGASLHRRFMSIAADNEIIVDRILEQIRQRDDQTSTSGSDESIKETIRQLTEGSLAMNSSEVDFDALIGYYNVSCTLTARPKDNPVGGKWTRNGSTRNVWVIRRTLQHVLPKRPGAISNAVAQAVNVIRLDLLFGWIPVWIVLRGDAVPLDQDDNTTDSKRPELLPGLSSRTIRVYFDRPRIAFGRKWVFSFGPTSSVVIDTPYVDSRIRIGKGGTSGTLFVFRRVPEDDTEATVEWNWLLNEDLQKSFVTKRKAATTLAILGMLSAVVSKVLEGVARKTALASTVLSTLALIWVALGTGGIETRGDTYTKGR